jgi:hypothetical protein
MQAPQQLVKCLAEGGQQDAALKVARVLRNCSSKTET